MPLPHLVTSPNGSAYSILCLSGSPGGGTYASTSPRHESEWVRLLYSLPLREPWWRYLCLYLTSSRVRMGPPTLFSASPGALVEVPMPLPHLVTSPNGSAYSILCLS